MALERMGTLDVEFLSLAIHGPFDEKDIATSPLKRLDTGRILDHLASMLERGLIQQAEHSYTMTHKSGAYLWNPDTPVWLRVLRLLDILPLPVGQISLYLDEPAAKIQDTLKVLRIGGLAMMYPVKKDNDLVQMYHITDEGKGRMERPKDMGPISSDDIISAVIRDVSTLEVDQHTKDIILSRLETLQRVLQTGVPYHESEPK